MTLAHVGAEAYRLHLMGRIERRLADAGYEAVAGVDEVGRGSLAGPVVAAAVIPNPRTLVPGVDDSKHLTAGQRERLAAMIRSSSIAAAVIPVPADAIDRINILQATRRAMLQAIEKLRPSPDAVLIDAMALDGTSMPCFSLVRGDSLSYAVACASILAKVERDGMMRELDRKYPHYGFASHKGYGAREHLDALRDFGPCPAHRLTFRSVLPHSDVRASGVGG